MQPGTRGRVAALAGPPAAHMLDTPHVHVAVVGSGFGGLAAAVRFLQEGETSLAVFERADGVGGVWRDNRYPGAACDVPSHLYSFAFAPNPDWSNRFARQPEILAYLERVADRFGVGPHLRLGHDVERLAWDDDAAVWRVATSRGGWTADVVVAAPGALAEPKVPDVPGLATFAGPAFHTSRWDPSLSLEGRRVAVVGTGASAVQVVPAIQPEVERLTLYQRTPPWVIPRRDRPIGRMADLYRRFPRLQRAVRGWLYGTREALGLPFRQPRLARVVGRVLGRHLRRQVRDADLRETLRPDYTLGCKRLTLSDDYYPALTQDNVEVVEGAVREVRPSGVVGADGVERPADVLVLATGFHVTDYPLTRLAFGRDGRSLAEVWGGSPRAHLGTTVAGFPNLFLLQGPNTGLGHNSVVLMTEAQVEHAVAAVRYLDAHRLAAVEPRPEAQAAFVAEVDRQMADTVWTSGCRSWYLDETGRNSTLWPGSVGSFRRRVAPFDPAEYLLRPAVRPQPALDNA